MDPKYKAGTDENREFLKANADELLNFGSRFPAPDGSAYYLGDDGSPMPERARETYETARMAHAYSIGALLGRESDAELADTALRGLLALEDTKNGGWFTGLDKDEQPLPGKQAYTHAFVILAASSGLAANRPGSKELLSRALEVFNDKFWDEKEGLVSDRWDTYFKELDTYRGLNANMHTVEAYLAAADVLNDNNLRERAGRIIRRVIDIASRNDWRIPEHYDENWTPLPDYNKDHPDDPFRPYGATPGHGFEWARLTLQWALSQNDEEITKKYTDAAEYLFARAAEDGWNSDGAPGIVYTTDWDGTPVVRDRMHWTLAEAISAAASLQSATGKQEYADWYAVFNEYLDNVVLDHVNGSWYHQLDSQNRPAATVWPGKPDIYHAFQASLIPMYAPDRSLAVLVGQ